MKRILPLFILLIIWKQSVSQTVLLEERDSVYTPYGTIISYCSSCLYVSSQIGPGGTWNWDHYGNIIKEGYFCWDLKQQKFFNSAVVSLNACKKESAITDSLYNEEKEKNCSAEQVIEQAKKTIQAKDDSERFYERDRDEQVIKTEKAVKNNDIWRIIAGSAIGLAVLEMIKR